MTVVMIGGRALQLLVTAEEAANLQEVARVTCINRPPQVTVQDGATRQEYILSGDMIAAMGVPAAPRQLTAAGRRHRGRVDGAGDAWPRGAKARHHLARASR